ncbi:ATP-grasp fold amidoligase family protein [Anaerococcus rubeinfantis]|uniref:ATP-grasp fold amidoligase family protein n=1 Tax=Anaerococcus rubeinfantis TaxID=1720199 RepID=UPI00073E8BC6|nr:ATP-grasp fold amidoligase family protein [Anaerococcus rubeinfantis]
MMKLLKFIRDKDYRFIVLSNRSFYNDMDDKIYIEKLFKSYMGYSLNLNNPKTFNEKLQWLKLYDRKPRYTMMVDKYKVREYIADKIGEEYLISLLGVWDDPDDIDFDSLPNKFVLKCNHDSGGLSICRDKKNFDANIAKKKLKKSLKTNYYYSGREWPYKNVPRKIIAEKYMVDDSNSDEFTDYKFFCFNGYVDCVMVCLDRNSGDPKFYFFDKDWKLKRLNKRGKEAPKDFTIPKPECIAEMFEIASKLSEGFPFVRVDLYQSYGKIYFGEMTFYPDSGFDSNILPEADLYLGSLIDINNIN